jgi:hypothetical protein
MVVSLGRLPVDYFVRAGHSPQDNVLRWMACKRGCRQSLLHETNKLDGECLLRLVAIRSSPYYTAILRCLHEQMRYFLKKKEPM